VQQANAMGNASMTIVGGLAGLIIRSKAAYRDESVWDIVRFPFIS